MGQRGSTEVLHSTAKSQTSYDEERGLIQRGKAGDCVAFEAIFRQHVSRVYRQAFKLIGNEAETEEVVQEVFLAVHKKVKTFRGESAFSTWLYRLTTNVALTRLRKRKRTKEVLLDDYLPRFQEDGAHEGRPVFNWGNELDLPREKKKLPQLIRAPLGALPPVDKAVIVLSDLEGISNREIGES